MYGKIRRSKGLKHFIRGEAFQYETYFSGDYIYERSSRYLYHVSLHDATKKTIQRRLDLYRCLCGEYYMESWICGSFPADQRGKCFLVPGSGDGRCIYLQHCRPDFCLPYISAWKDMEDCCCRIFHAWHSAVFSYDAGGNRCL